MEVEVIPQTSRDFEPEMVDIPAGTFKMGSDEYDDEKPIHNVTLSAFQMGKYPVTQAQYEAVMGEKRPNSWGLYDMHGNVWEWCADEWHDSYQDKPANLKQNGNIIWSNGNITNKSCMIIRGGSWFNSSMDCRSAIRYIFYAEYCYDNIGFRVAVSCF